MCKANRAHQKTPLWQALLAFGFAEGLLYGGNHREGGRSVFHTFRRLIGCGPDRFHDAAMGGVGIGIAPDPLAPQIQASGTAALGSYLGWLAKKRSSRQGCRMRAGGRRGLERAGMFLLRRRTGGPFGRTQADQRSHFYHPWTLKESFLQSRGEGFFIDPASFTIKIKSGGIHLMTPPGEIDRTYRLRTFDLDRGCAMAGCSEGEPFAQDVTRV